MEYLFLLISISLLSVPGFSYQNHELNKFCSDGCTHAPDGTFQKPHEWFMCCTQHDLAYWAGGSPQDKFNADTHLHACLLNTNARPWEANLYLAAVVAFGASHWGTGWSDFDKNAVKFNPLSSAEQSQVKRMTPMRLPSAPNCKPY